MGKYYKARLLWGNLRLRRFRVTPKSIKANELTKINQSEQYDHEASEINLWRAASQWFWQFPPSAMALPISHSKWRHHGLPTGPLTCRSLFGNQADRTLRSPAPLTKTWFASTNHPNSPVSGRNSGRRQEHEGVERRASDSATTLKDETTQFHAVVTGSWVCAYENASQVYDINFSHYFQFCTLQETGLLLGYSLKTWINKPIHNFILIINEVVV